MFGPYRQMAKCFCRAQHKPELQDSGIGIVHSAVHAASGSIQNLGLTTFVLEHLQVWSSHHWLSSSGHTSLLSRRGHSSGGLRVRGHLVLVLRVKAVAHSLRRMRRGVPLRRRSRETVLTALPES